MSNSDLDDVCDRLDNIEAAVKNQRVDLGSWAAGLVIFWLIYLGVSAAWHSKVRYMIQYEVDYREVQVSPRPHDCEFLSAPIGSKYCHYDRSISTIRTSKDQASGRPIVSFDEGKTWSWNDDGTFKRSVEIGWAKVED